MSLATSRIRRIKQRKLKVDLNTNATIKRLQRKLVELTFSAGNHSKEYFQTLGEIKKLRKEGLS